MASNALSDRTQRATFRIAGTQIAVREALRVILDHPLLAQLSDDLRGDANLVLAETLNNVVEHAYVRDDGWIELRLKRYPGWLHCEVVDTGRPMPNEEIPIGLPQALNDHNDLPEGGFGWFLIRQLTQNLTYRRRNACNHLSFQLNFEQ